MKLWKTCLSLGVLALAAGCATPSANRDYTAFREARPRSVLVLPPLNDSLEVGAAEAVLAQVSYPLAESGYYVFPVAVVNEVLRQNGVQNAEDARAIPADKLRDIFGADTVLFIDVKKYGTSYAILSSASVVTLDARLVDLASGTELWSGTASASSAEQQSSGGGLLGALVMAVVNQIVESTSDYSYTMAGVADMRLLAAGRANGLLYGPYSQRAGTD
ncbi:DUF799 domain-containing protein [Kerstersia sp.]|uniref:DUF799 domain-containing protein n=1 Tax=Kerstersia sp. TaxID=1930783 RepID=UPI003F9147B7